MIERQEIERIKKLIELAMQQNHQDQCGKIIFDIRRWLNNHRLTFEEFYILANEQTQSNPYNNGQSKSFNETIHSRSRGQENHTSNHTSEDIPFDDGDEYSIDETDVWVRPWARLLEERLDHMAKIGKYVKDIDIQHVINMQSKRTVKARTLNDIQWLYQISRRTLNKDTIPPQAVPWLRANGSDEV